MAFWHFANFMHIFMHIDMRNRERAGQLAIPLSTMQARGIPAESEPRPSRSEWACQSRNYRVTTDYHPGKMPSNLQHFCALGRIKWQLWQNISKNTRGNFMIFNWQSIWSAGLRFLFRKNQRLASLLEKNVSKYLRCTTRKLRGVYLCQNEIHWIHGTRWHCYSNLVQILWNTKQSESIDRIAKTRCSHSTEEKHTETIQSTMALLPTASNHHHDAP